MTKITNLPIWTSGNIKSKAIFSDSYNHAYFVDYLHPDTLKGMLENCQKRFSDHLKNKEFDKAFTWFVNKNHINDIYQTILIEKFDNIKDSSTYALTAQQWMINNGAI
jgi:hypothetical protein